MQDPQVAEWSQTEGLAVDRLFAESYRDLRKLAHSRLGPGCRGALLGTTALVHESYLRLAAAGRLDLKDRAHLLFYAGRAMRSVIVDLARKRQAARHGGGAVCITLDPEVSTPAAGGDREILRVHLALRDMERADPRLARIVEMKYFAGMTDAEIAEALSVGERTVRREWEKARLWLSQALS